jgi:hypothetical protein
VGVFYLKIISYFYNKKIMKEKVLVVIYGIGSLAGLYNVFHSNTDFEKFGWMSSALFAFNAMVCQIEIISLKKDKNE